MIAKEPWLILMRVTDGRRRWWVVADQTDTLRGVPGMTRSDIFHAWRQLRPITCPVTRIKGVCRMSEAAMEIAHRRGLLEGGGG